MYRKSIIRIHTIVGTFFLGILFNAIHVLNAAEITSRENKRAILEALIQYVIQPPPDRFRIVAEVQVDDPAWSETQILEEVKRQEDFMRAVEQYSNQAAKLKLREFRIQALRKEKSGTKILMLQESRLFQLWMLDQTDMSLPNAGLLAKRGIAYDRSHANLHDSGVGEWQSYLVNHSLQSATVDARPSKKWERNDLWQAGVIEPQAALLLMSLVIATNSRSAFFGLNTSFSGAIVDPVRLDALAADQSKDLVATVNEEPFEGMPHIHIQLMERSYSQAQKRKVSYWLDKGTMKRLSKIEISDPNNKTHYTSIRQNYDNQNFPWIWRTETTDGKTRVSRRYTFKDVDIKGLTVSTQQFLPIFPTNYMVWGIRASGKPFPIQNPGNHKISNITLGGQLPSRWRWMHLVAVLVVLGLPVVWWLIRARQTQIVKEDSAL